MNNSKRKKKDRFDFYKGFWTALVINHKNKVRKYCIFGRTKLSGFFSRQEANEFIDEFLTKKYE